MTPKPDNLPKDPADMTLSQVLQECARILHNAGGAERGAGDSAELANAALRWAEIHADIASAANAILRAGCSGVPTLTWMIDRKLLGREPLYAQGDASFHNAQLYEAVEQGLIDLRDDPGQPMPPAPEGGE
jgi:hypothetical protein